MLPGLDLVNVGENEGTNVEESASIPIHPKMDISKVGQSKTLQDVGQLTARDVADKLINAWVTGRYNSEFYKAMKKATMITGMRYRMACSHQIPVCTTVPLLTDLTSLLDALKLLLQVSATHLERIKLSILVGHT